MKLSLRTLSISAAFIALSCVGISPVAASQINLLANGSFEDTILSNNSWATYSSINGWTATPNGQIEVQRNVAGAPYDGFNLVELDSHNYDAKKFDAQNPLGFYQDVTTVAGQDYTLSFAYSARPNTAAGENVFNILVGDPSNVGNILTQNISDGAGGSNTVWSIFTTTFKANSALSRVQFNYTGPLDTYGSYIDDVKLVTAVPEPTAITGIVLAGLGLITLKKRNASKKSLVA
ncbi:PEP-CTERM sorting domain-containing protein [Nostoc sp.]|uniref:PEP-CTERM sorting domain-containing protein n=1 Tax=Nostoc sp. TaxID=1180 RepID=UPI002FF9FEEE